MNSSAHAEHFEKTYDSLAVFDCPQSDDYYKNQSHDPCAYQSSLPFSCFSNGGMDQYTALLVLSQGLLWRAKTSWALWSSDA